MGIRAASAGLAMNTLRLGGSSHFNLFRFFRRFRLGAQDSIKRIVDVFESVFAFDHLQPSGFAAYFARAFLPELRIEIHVHLAARVEEILYSLAEFVVGPA